MKRVMCYGDSNTWGYDPVETGADGGAAVRYPEHVRWTGVMQNLLGSAYRVLEEGLNGRTTVFEDPTAYGRSGCTHLEVALRSCDPVDCVILMLGTNDLKDTFHASAYMIANGMARLIRICREVLRYTRSARAKILVVAPANVSADQNGRYQYDFSALSVAKGEVLRASYRALAEQMDCTFLDANDHIVVDPADGVHLSADSHRKLGEVMAKTVRKLLEE